MNSRIVDAHRLMVSGKLKCTELSEMCLQRIRETIKLNCYITVNEQNALVAAKQSDDRYKNGKSLGVLDGIPVAIKDNFSTANVRTTCASRMLENYVPTYSATVVDKLCEQNGAIMLGKTNMDEFAMGCSNIDSFFGPCKNPWSPSFRFKVVRKDGHPYEINSDEKQQEKKDQNEDDWLISGGSSGGSAVAVASGSCFAALGSDTGGSTRNPSSHVGVVGFKPSYGLLSRYGLIPLTHSMDTPSIIARSVEDISVVFHSIRGHDVRDSTSVKEEIKVPIKECRLENIKIGIPQEYESDAMAEEIKLAWNQIADLLADRGAKVNQVSLPHTPYSSSCYMVINCSEVASNLACYDGIEYGYRAQSVPGDSFEDLISRSRHQGFGNLVKSRILSGNFFLLQENYDKFFLKALKIRRLVCEDFDFVFNGEDRVDFLLTPVTLHPAYRISEWNNRNAIDDSQDEDFCTQPSNLAGLPAITLPCKITKDGRPIGLQLIGPKYSDYFLLSLANILEKLVEFPSLVYDGGEKKRS